MLETRKLVSWVMVVIPSILLAVAVLFAQLSGNDKAPYIVFLVIGLDLLLFILTIIITLVQKDSRSFIKCLLAGLPILYVIVVILLARSNSIDSHAVLLLLGFN